MLKQISPNNNIIKMNKETEGNVTNYFAILPIELIFKIFSYLPARHLMKFRRTNFQLKSLIEDIVCNDGFWMKSCEKEFKSCYMVAKNKAESKMSWYILYQCLSLWPDLMSATEDYNEFAVASDHSEEIFNVIVLKNGLLGVHTKCAIDYYDIKTLNLSLKHSIEGSYSEYMENKKAVVTKSYHLHLIVERKIKNRYVQRTFDNIKLSILTDDSIYLVGLTDEIFICDINSQNITYELLTLPDDRDGVVCIGHDNGNLNVLTYQRNIYSISKNKDIVLKQSLDSEQNILNALYKYNFLEHLDWRIYFQWMFVLNHTIPEGPISNITIVKPYGDIFFVGTQFGQVYIFHKPFINGELDIFNTEPVHLLNLMDMSSLYASECVILHIDVLEWETGHTVYVATPKKVAVFKFKHNFSCQQFWKPDNELVSG